MSLSVPVGRTLLVRVSFGRSYFCIVINPCFLPGNGPLVLSLKQNRFFRLYTKNYTK
jgi:hypothetical protein